MSNGCNQNPIGDCSEAEGLGTTANGTASHAEGYQTTANGEASHTEGNTTTAGGSASHTEGYLTQSTASADTAHAEGTSTTASGVASHAEGYLTTASGLTSHAQGGGTLAGGSYSHAEGRDTQATGDVSHAEGFMTIASGTVSHAEGAFTDASGSVGSHAEGVDTTSSAFASHAEGLSTTASGNASHAEGEGSTASGSRSHAEGHSTTASGEASHAEGNGTIADGNFAHTEGLNTTANGFDGVHVMGQGGGPDPMNPDDLDFSWYLVNGALGGVVAKILNDGSACFEGDVSANIVAPVACDFAEMFESSNGQLIEVGYFVAFDGETEKIRKANSRDDYIVGITSSNPAVLADIQDPECSKYILDKWNRPIYEEVIIPPEKDNKGNILREERKINRKKINPNWSKDCSSRLDKQEWMAVGLVGKLLVRDDGTCQPGSYCKPNDEGIATKARKGYRVMKRTGSNQILVLVK